MHQEVGLLHDLEGGAERLHQLVRQLADEPDGVREQDRLAAGQGQTARAGVERREQAVLDQHARVGESVEQRGLAGVGVAHQAHHPLARPQSGAALRAARGGDLLEVGLETRHATQQPTPVHLELGLARAPGADATGLLGQGRAPYPAVGAAGTATGPAPPGPSPLGSGHSGRRCRGSPPYGRWRYDPGSSRGCVAARARARRRRPRCRSRGRATARAAPGPCPAR